MTGPFDNPEIINIAKKSITPLFVKNSVEAIIDGTVPWLEGKAVKPIFSVDLVPVINAFADNSVAFGRNRFASLPLCARNQIPITDDILTINCKPKGLNIETELSKDSSQIKLNSDFLPIDLIKKLQP